MVLLSSPLKMTPGNHGKHIFFLEIEISTKPNHNQNSQLKKFEKTLSSASVDDEGP